VTILLFVLVPALFVAAYAGLAAWRNRQPSSVESGVDAFRREMSALSPHQAPEHRRPGERPPSAGGSPRREERPPGHGPSAPPGAR
jgi:hypothetical protein